jgi:hypothetical protein
LVDNLNLWVRILAFLLFAGLIIYCIWSILIRYCYYVWLFCFAGGLNQAVGLSWIVANSVLLFVEIHLTVCFNKLLWWSILIRYCCYVWLFWFACRPSSWFILSCCYFLNWLSHLCSVAINLNDFLINGSFW